MARTKWDELLPGGATSSLSRNEIVQQLARATSPGSSGGNLNNASGSTAAAEVVSGLTRGSAAGDFTEQISSLTSQIGNLASIQQTQVSVTQDNTQAITQNTASKSSGGSSVGSAVGSVASALLGGGSILSPIVSGLMSVFGAGDSSQTTTAPFMLPARVQYEGGISGGASGQVEPVSYGESGQPRAQATSPTPQVNIQVNAMDSQSFLDHSDDIAKAVRAALLNSNSLSDVISDL